MPGKPYPHPSLLAACVRVTVTTCAFLGLLEWVEAALMLGPAASGSHQQHSKRPWHKGIRRQEPLVWDGTSRIIPG